MALNFKTFWRKKSRWSSITKMFGSTELEKLSCYNTHTFYNLIIIFISFLNLILTNSVLFYHLLIPSYCVWIISDLLINLSLFKRINFFLSFTLLCFLFYNFYVAHLQIVWSVNLFGSYKSLHCIPIM